MGISSIGAGAPSVFVDSYAELQAAYASLSTSFGGGTIYLSDDFPDQAEISLIGGGRQPVHITSANPGDPAELSRIEMTGVDNVKISNVHVDSTGVGRPAFHRDLEIRDSSRIEITDSEFSSNGSISFIPGRGGVLGERLGTFENSQNITFESNYIERYEQGLIFEESSGIRFADNEITLMQGDGLRLVGVQDVMVEDNHFHDFAATPNEFTHSDFIQMWSYGTDTVSQDVTITGNVLDTGNGVAVQAIFLRNIAYEDGDRSHVYEDFTITDNLIYTGAANGIAVGQTDGLRIADNTLLWNEDAVTIKATGDTSWPPRIVVEDGVRDARIEDNITVRIAHQGNAVVRGNNLISYDPRDENYVGNHFVDASGGGDIGATGGWELLEDSSFVGTGASVTQPGGEGPTASGGGNQGQAQQPVSNFAPEPIVAPAPEPVVAPAPEPAPAAPVAAGPNTGAQASTLFATDFESGLVDSSGFDSTLRTGADRNIVDTPDGSGYQIGSGRMVRLDVGNEQIHNLDSFGLEMEITLLGSDDVGRFLHFPRTFEASVDRDGTVTFELRTDEGVFQVNSGDVVLNDGETHLFAVGYDDAAGTLSMSIDGTVVGTTDASGSTNDASFHGMTVGSIWGNSVNAVVDDIFLGTDPMEAGVDLSLDVGETFDPAPAPPEGGLVGDGVGNPNPVAPSAGDDDVPEGTDFFTTLLHMDFEDGISDGSRFDSSFRNADESDVVWDGRGDSALRVDEDNFVRLDADNEQIHELDGFGLSLDIRLLDHNDTGRFIHFPRAFEAVIEEDRSVTFQLETDAGMFRVNSGDATLDGPGEHNFSVGYDGNAGQLTMAIDGEVVGSVAAFGETSEMVHHGMAIGSIWGDSVAARIDNVWLGEPDPASDVNPDAGLFHALISSAVEAAPDEDHSNDDEDALAA